MQYQTVLQGKFLRRPNRFIAHVVLEGEEVVCHVKNTGRCRELLVPGCTVYLETASNLNRKTKYDLIAVKKDDLLINMDAQAPNAAFGEWAVSGGFLPGLTKIKPEYRHGDSRFDFYMEQGKQRILVEIKGVTLEENGIVYFPDAPTERGLKHVKGLIAAGAEGFERWICFVVQMNAARAFQPNDRTQPAFGAALREAQAAGVHLLAVTCHITPEEMTIGESVPIQLELQE